MPPEDPSASAQQLVAYAKDLAQIYEAERAKRQDLEVANQKMRAMLDSMGDGLVTVDDRGQITAANSSFAELVGQELPNIIGLPLFGTLPEDWVDVVRDLKALKKPDELMVSGVGNRNRVFSVKRNPVRRSDGGYEGAVLLIQDETGRQRAENLRAEFLALISHEVRTPATSILGFASLLEDTLSDRVGEEKEFLSAISESSHRLVNTIQKITDYSRLASNDDIPCSQIDLRDVLLRVCEDLSAEAARRNCTIVRKLPDHECPIWGRIDLLESGVRNVLENGIQFSPQDSEVHLDLTRVKDQYMIRVRDHGRGIPPDQLEEIFIPFYQLEEPFHRTHEGLGVGLSVARRAAELHGGNIQVESQPRQGSTFKIILPVKKQTISQSRSDRLSQLKQELSQTHRQALSYEKDTASSGPGKRESATRLHSLEKQLIRAEKLALVGQMSAGTVHEMNNLLFPIIANAGLLLAETKGLSEDALSMIEGIASSGERAAALLTRLLDFSRAKSTGLAELNLKEPVETALQLLSFKFSRANVSFKLRFLQEPSELCVRGCRSQLEQVFANLALNAVEAMSRGGSLTVEVLHCEDDPQLVETRFIDEGSGIPAEVKEQIFDPFFTTKDEGQGTGLGLFVAKSIVEGHGGSIAVESVEGKGTTFSIRLQKA